MYKFIDKYFSTHDDISKNKSQLMAKFKTKQMLIT